MSNAQKIIDRIRVENIRPLPKWTFTIPEAMKWVAYAFFVLMGGMSFSIILFAISVNGFDLIQHFMHSKVESVLVLLPLLWLGVLTFVLGASIASVMQTGRAYKFSFGKWVSLSVGISITLGTLFFLAGGARWLEHKFETNVESYESLFEKKAAIWSQPNLGTLSGEVISFDAQTISLRDWKGRIWSVSYAQAFVAPILKIEAGVQIKLNGTLTGENAFDATSIKPWGGRPGQCVY